MKNPFAVLGITPNVLRGLTAEDALKLAKSQYRALSTTHHPDKGGKEGAFAPLARAMEELADPVKLGGALKSYLSPRRDQLAQLESELEDSDRRLRQTSEQASALLRQVARTGHIIGCRVLVQDTMSAWLKSEARKQNRSLGLNGSTSLVDVSTDKAGYILRRAAEFTREVRLEDARPQKPDVYWLRQDIWLSKNASYAVSKTGKQTRLRIVGSIPIEKDLLEYTGYGLRALAAFDSISERTQSITNGYTLESFPQLVPLLMPTIDVGRTLIGVDPGNTEPTFFILGKILGISYPK